MSGVYKRNRTESELQWVMTARKIRIEIDQLAHSEKVIPKSWRFTHALRLFKEALAEHWRMYGPEGGPDCRGAVQLGQPCVRCGGQVGHGGDDWGPCGPQRLRPHGVV